MAGCNSVTPAEVVVGREHGESRFQVFELLRECVGQPIQPLEEKPLGAVQPLNVRGAYREYLLLAHAAPGRPLGPDHFAGRVIHRGVFIFLDDRPVLGVGAKGQIDRLGVGGETIRADLNDPLERADLEGVVVALVRLGPIQLVVEFVYRRFGRPAELFAPAVLSARPGFSFE